MTSDQVTQLGAYVYRDVVSNEPQRVEVVNRDGVPYVRNEQFGDEDLLTDLSGSFEALPDIRARELYRQLYGVDWPRVRKDLPTASEVQPPKEGPPGLLIG